MTIADIEAMFEKFSEDEYNKFERIENPLHPRPDICAFLLLDRLCPNPGHDLISCSDYDEFYLETSLEDLAKVTSEDDILTLVRCGVRIDSDSECLCMFA